MREKESMIFNIRQIRRGIARHKYKTILTGLIGVLSVLLLHIYAGNMDSTERQLKRLPEVMRVQAKVSNLNGSLEEGMTIREDRVQAIRASEHAAEAVFTVRLRLGFGAFTPEEYEGNLSYYGAGMNAIGGVPGLKEEEITFLPGKDVSALETAEKVCIMDAALMEREGLRLGDEVEMTSFCYRYEERNYEIFLDILGTDVYRIIGAMRIGAYEGNWVPADVIFPLDCMRELFHRQGIEFMADSGSFVVKDPFRLNECKEEMEGIGMLPVASRADFSYDGNALTIMDESFIRSAEALEENLALLRGMFPFVAALVILIGYICSYLSIQSRKEEYALLRSLGAGRCRSFFVFFGETAVVAALAVLCGSGVAFLLFSVSLKVSAQAGTLFFFAFLAGTAAALLSLHRLSVMEMLSKND